MRPRFASMEAANAGHEPPVTVAILAGGLGTRLRAAVADRPKVLAEVHGRPFLDYWLEALEQQGFREIVLCTGHQADAVQTSLGSTWGDLQLRYSAEPTPLGTGGALRHALPLLQSDRILALNGDSFCRLSLRGFLRSCSGARAGLVVARVGDSRRFGSVRLGADRCVAAFEEKPSTPRPGWINAGIYFLDRSRLESLPAGVPLSLERDVLPRWLPDGIRAYRSHGPFLDIGTPESYAAAESFFAQLNPTIAVGTCSP